MKVKVGISNRHVHLTESDKDILFGSGYELTKLRDLTQPGQFATEEVLTIESDSKKIENVRIIGPLRSYTQVEISRSDALRLKLDPPIRSSSDIKGSEKIRIIGPNGSVDKEEGCIIANRHIHMTQSDADKYNYKNDDIVKVKLHGIKGGTIDNVYIKIMNDAFFELHIDTDDAAAHLVNQGDEADIINEK